jgi:hypothetical protein
MADPSDILGSMASGHPLPYVHDGRHSVGWDVSAVWDRMCRQCGTGCVGSVGWDVSAVLEGMCRQFGMGRVDSVGRDVSAVWGGERRQCGMCRFNTIFTMTSSTMDSGFKRF